MKQMVYNFYRWVAHSKNALAMSSLSILGNSHPFIPSDSPLHQAINMDMAGQSRIVAEDMDTGQEWPSPVIKINMKVHAHCAVFSPDGLHLAASLDDGTVGVWDAAAGAPLLELKGHTQEVRCIAFSPDGRLLASASADWTARIWDATTGVSLQELKGHKGEVHSVAYSPDGHNLASSSDDCTVHVWDTVTGASLRQLRGHTQWVWDVAFSPDGHSLASAALPRLIAQCVYGIPQRVHLCEYSRDTLLLCDLSHIHPMAVIWPLPLGMPQYAYGTWQQDSLGIYSKDDLHLSTPSHSHQMAITSPLPQMITPYVCGMWLVGHFGGN